MRLIKCDYCGAEIEDGGEKYINPQDEGWCVVEGRKLSSTSRRDICPRCVPKETEIND